MRTIRRVFRTECIIQWYSIGDASDVRVGTRATSGILTPVRAGLDSAGPRPARVTGERCRSVGLRQAGAGAGAGGGAGTGAGAGLQPGEGDAPLAPAPTITMPGTNTGANFAHYDDDRPPSAEQPDGDDDSPKQKKQGGKKEQSREGEGAGGKRGWFGGIFTKLSLRPPNQMILPDDKNPTIVWDEQKKRWRNLDGDAEESDQPPPPPPKMADLARAIRSGSPPLQPPQSASPPAPSAPSALSAPPAAPLSNIFKMQKGRHIKKSYVDVFNPSGAATRALPPAADVLPPPPPPAPTTYFVPTSPPLAADSNAQVIHVFIPPSPIPTPSSLSPAYHEGGIYDPTQMPIEEQYRSGI